MIAANNNITELPFNFKTTLYQPENAYWMAIFSNLVYLTVGDKTGDKKDVTPDEDSILSKLKDLDSEFLAVF